MSVPNDPQHPTQDPSAVPPLTPVPPATPAVPGGPGVEPTKVALGQRAARGVLWFMTTTLVRRVAGIVAQLLLAKLLIEDDFGLYGLALTVTMVLNTLASGGVSEVLIQRQGRYKREINAAIWLSLLTGLLAANAMVPLGFFAQWAYAAPELAGLIVIQGLQLVFLNLCSVVETGMSVSLAFRSMAIIRVVAVVATVVLQVVMAAQGWGAMSFVIPPTVVAGTRLAIVWLWVRPTFTISPQVHRWPGIFGDSVYVVGSKFIAAIIGIGDYAVLGLLYDKGALGYYVVAFSLSSQAVNTLVNGLWQVLYASLAAVKDNVRRQADAFLNFVSLLSLVSVPLCLLQASVADPLLRLLFADKWETSIPLLQVLSVGMVFRIVGNAGGNLMQAQGRFRTRFWFAFGAAWGYFAVVGLAAWWGYEDGSSMMLVAIASSVYYIATLHVRTWLALTPVGYPMRVVVASYRGPVAAGLLAFGPAWGVSLPIPGDVAWGQCSRMAVCVAVGLPLYLALIRLIAPNLIAQARQRFQQALRRR